MKLFTFVVAVAAAVASSVAVKYQRGEGSIFHLNNAIIISAFFLLLSFLENLISREAQTVYLALTVLNDRR